MSAAWILALPRHAKDVTPAAEADGRRPLVVGESRGSSRLSCHGRVEMVGAEFSKG